MEGFELDIAYWFSTQEQRTRGLTGRSMGVDECAVFEYPNRVPRSFWNKGVAFDLFLVAVDCGEVVDCKFMPAGDEHAVTVRQCETVLECRVPVDVGSYIEFGDGRVEVSGQC